MKSLLRQLFSPLLTPLESGDEPYAYRPSHRKILLGLSSLFLMLSTGMFFLAKGQDPGYLIPVVVFGGVALVGLVVGSVGKDRAVSKLWGSK